MAARAGTDFPDPDSPTMPSTSWGAREKLMPRTARTVPSPVEKSTTRWSTVIVASVMSGAHPVLRRVEGLAQAVADEEDRKDEHHQDHHRENEQPPLGGGRVLALVDEEPQGDVWWLAAPADVGEGRPDDDGQPEPVAGLLGDDVGQHDEDGQDGDHQDQVDEAHESGVGAAAVEAGD